ncbi:MAG: ribosome small subunit-dependent GTPase A [Deltaproteobacteria bacterium]|nr:ribosome small subunit-dependent GTPase A [Deltaproteobacteria bacterium]
MTQINLEALGYDGFFDLQWTASGFKDFTAARVIAEHKGAYTVINTHGEFLAKITGKQMFSATKRADYPAVGDWVAIAALDKERAIIHHILPRKTILKKKYNDKQDTQIIATNIDVAFTVESLDSDYNLNRLERYLVLANEGGIKSAIVLNKTDLVSEAELQRRVEEIKNRFGRIDCISTSTITERGLDDLMHYIGTGKTYCFLGSSGVGKSSLINKLLKRGDIKTREISDFTGRGKHTTTSREMYFLENGGIVIDNPGTREVGIADAGAGIANVFNEITALSKECKYADCTHIHEPGCAVLKAVEEGRLDRAQYQNYIKLKKENEFYEMTDIEKIAKDRKFGKFIKKAKEHLKEFKT